MKLTTLIITTLVLVSANTALATACKAKNNADRFANTTAPAAVTATSSSSATAVR